MAQRRSHSPAANYPSPRPTAIGRQYSDSFARPGPQFSEPLAQSPALGRQFSDPISWSTASGRPFNEPISRASADTAGSPEGATAFNLHVHFSPHGSSGSSRHYEYDQSPSFAYHYPQRSSHYHNRNNMPSPPATFNSPSQVNSAADNALTTAGAVPLSMRLSMPFRSVFSRGFRSDLLDFNHFDNVFRQFDQPLNSSSGQTALFEDYRHPFAFDHSFDDDPFFNPALNRDPPSAAMLHSPSTTPFRRDVTPTPSQSSRVSYSRSSSSGSTATTGSSVVHTGGAGSPPGELEDTVHHIIHSEPPDQLQQRVKIFIAQDRARSLDSSHGPPGAVSATRQHFPRISARLPHGGSLSFSFSTTSTTMHINSPGGSNMESAQVPPHPLLTLEQKRQLKERLLAQKNELISGPNTSATILTSEHDPGGGTGAGSLSRGVPTSSGSGGGAGGPATANSVAERVMWFEGFPQLQISHQPASRTHRSAAHIALHNWKMANQGMMMEERMGSPFGQGFARPPSVEREIPIIRETDSVKPNSSAISITLEAPSKQSARITSPPLPVGSQDILPPSKPGNHALSTAVITPQMPVLTEIPSPRGSAQTLASRKDIDLRETERIIPTILPSPEPKPVDRKWFRESKETAAAAPETPREGAAGAFKAPTRSEVQRASENIMRALQNGMRKEEKMKEKVIEPLPLAMPVKKAASPPKVTSPTTTAPLDIPQFHYPRGRPTTKADSEYVLMEKVKKAFGGKTELKLEDMKELMQVLGLPFYWRRLLFLAALGGEAKEEPAVTFDMIWNTWKRITANCYDDASRFVSLLAKPGCDYLLPNDFVPLIQDVVDTHPGLNILKEAPEFHARYINTVIARIFFCVNRSWSGSITIEELRRNNFLQVLATLDLEDDINVITEYFSYEHFYVIYCKFWELDRDHDLLIDKADLARHNDHAISSKMIDRIFSGAVTRGSNQKEGKMTYSEFVWFLISEEDKRHPRSIEYWFRCMDLDGDGVLSLYELEYFYVEQLQRMKALGIEALPFEDIACQMLDMVHPKHKEKILLTDLKRCRMTPLFFDTFFNIEKYLLHEHRDPFASAKVDSEDNEPISDWDRYAAEEYELLVSEDAATEDL
ncbi:uncharacterized protein LOC129589053 [Paramacrobiotus metropolitanus]|uniref:uncharacterized protein LOC129589053 n=1 Tax=Paramacrobiotus metropolitanus TaxID=2943436 RepID=UPI0024456156|nr:uncharacterized protein LOC129589053 [Paramacrobiotus metropolitanus]